MEYIYTEYYKYNNHDDIIVLVSPFVDDNFKSIEIAAEKVNYGYKMYYRHIAIDGSRSPKYYVDVESGGEVDTPVIESPVSNLVYNSSMDFVIPNGIGNIVSIYYSSYALGLHDIPIVEDYYMESSTIISDISDLVPSGDYSFSVFFSKGGVISNASVVRDISINTNVLRVSTIPVGFSYSIVNYKEYIKDDNLIVKIKKDTSSDVIDKIKINFAGESKEYIYNDLIYHNISGIESGRYVFSITSSDTHIVTENPYYRNVAKPYFELDNNSNIVVVKNINSNIYTGSYIVSENVTNVYCNSSYIYHVDGMMSDMIEAGSSTTFISVNNNSMSAIYEVKNNSPQIKYHLDEEVIGMAMLMSELYAVTKNNNLIRCSDNTLVYAYTNSIDGIYGYPFYIIVSCVGDTVLYVYNGNNMIFLDGNN